VPQENSPAGGAGGESGISIRWRLLAELSFHWLS